MNTKQQASEIANLLLNGLHQVHRSRAEAGHDNCFSLEDVEAFCRERANNLAMALPELVAVDVPKAAIDENAVFDRLSRAMISETAVEAAIEAEGTPAVKDAFGAFVVATDELMKEAIKIQSQVASELSALRAAVFAANRTDRLCASCDRIENGPSDQDQEDAAESADLARERGNQELRDAGRGHLVR